MEWLGSLQNILIQFLPLLVTILFVGMALSGINWAFRSQEFLAGRDNRFLKQLIVLFCVSIGIIVAILVLPIAESTQNQLLALLGLLLTAIIALSSTTFVANIMASFMLRLIKCFRAGDFIRVGEKFGRVTERGLLHTEIQTEDGDLTTLPNQYLVTQPVSVIRSTGTVVSATISLGYDNAPTTLEPLLLEAATKAKLNDPFVQVLELGDFSVTYRVAGFLEEVKQLLSTRSNLRIQMMQSLHGAGIEIVSPAFMNQRRLDGNQPVMPKKSDQGNAPPDQPNADALETRVFDKAEEAERVEKLQSEYETAQKEVRSLENQLADSGGDERQQLSIELKAAQARRENIAITLKEASHGNDDQYD